MTHRPTNIPERPTATETRRAIAAGETSCAEAVRAVIDDLESRNPTYHALLEIHANHAIQRAGELDKRLSSGDVLPMAGVCITLKDNICLDRGRTTCASRMLENYESPYSATAAMKLEAAGAVVVGKANLDEFAMGSSCEHSAFGCSMNPWDTDAIPGGSSGGSASAVAAGLVPIALGSDTGGSIRQPASHCGVVGFKPTYGRVSRYGLVAFGSSLDQIGPMARSVEDAALCYQVMAGHDHHDATSHPGEVGDVIAALDQTVAPLRLGVPKEARGEGLHPDVASTLDQTIERAQEAGAEIVEIELPHNDAAIAAYYIVASAEASSNLARYDGIRFGSRPETLSPTSSLEDLYTETRSELFGEEVKRRILLGTHVLSSGYYDAYYNTALRARRLIKSDYDRAFEVCDAVLMPAAPTPAFKRGEKLDDPLSMYLADLFTVGVNLAGLPGITIPAGITSDNPTLPIGMQLITPAFEDTKLLRIAHSLEAVLG